MSKTLFLGVFVFAAGAYGACWPGYSCPVAMPEPTAIPELILGACGLGYFAWRNRNRAH
jgi:hypothetical protein